MPTSPPSSSSPLFRGWSLHGDGRSITPGAVVTASERLSWPRTIGIGMQHIVAMFGATFLVPLLTGFDPATTLFFTGLGTLLFLAVTAGRLPSYLGSSFALIAPIAAVTGFDAKSGTPLDQAKASLAQGGIIMAGASLLLIGVIVHFAGVTWIDRLMPPIVTGAIVSLIGFNLAPAAWSNVKTAPVTAVVTIVAILLITVLFKGIMGRLAILLGVLVGYATAMIRGEVDYSAIDAAGWVGAPHFRAPSFDLSLMGLFVPVVLVLIAENIGHVKSVSAMTGENLDDLTGRALISDGLSTILAGSGGGSGTTTYAENIGVMAATRVYSTAAYWVAAFTAIALAFIPKFGALILTIPEGVLGGATLVLYGLIGMLGIRIWMDNGVDFNNPVNLVAAATAMIAGIGNLTLSIGSLELEGIAWGSVGIIVGYPILRWLYRRIGEGQFAAFRE